MIESRSHLFIPDTQVKAGVPLDHLTWIGKYVLEKRPDVIVHAGDHADMESLSHWDKGKLQFEGRRYRRDIDAANYGFELLCAPMEEFNERQTTTDHLSRRYRPERHVTLGNHEDRIRRAVEEDPKLEGLMSVADLDFRGWQVHPFLVPVRIDGVYYAHYFANPMTGRPYGGAVKNRVRQVGHSFSMGHQQTLDYGVEFTSAGEQRNGLVAGACYLHDEDYKGPQGNAHWRGVIVKHQVSGGAYDPMFVSLDYLCRRYEGVTLADYEPHVFWDEVPVVR